LPHFLYRPYQTSKFLARGRIPNVRIKRYSASEPSFPIELVNFTLLLGIGWRFIWGTRRAYAGCGRKSIAEPVVDPGLLLFMLRPVPPDCLFVVTRNASMSAAPMLSWDSIVA
jgi:hypothetical protein